MASTTSSLARVLADGPGPAPGTRDGAGDSYVLFGSATIGGSANHVTNIGGDGMQTLTGSAAATTWWLAATTIYCSATAAPMC